MQKSASILGFEKLHLSNAFVIYDIKKRLIICYFENFFKIILCWGPCMQNRKQCHWLSLPTSHLPEKCPWLSPRPLGGLSLVLQEESTSAAAQCFMGFECPGQTQEVEAQALPLFGEMSDLVSTWQYIDVITPWLGSSLGRRPSWSGPISQPRPESSPILPMLYLKEVLK